MKKNLESIRRWALLVPLNLLFVLGCQKDLTLSEFEKNASPTLTIEEAKTFFEKNVNSANLPMQKKEEPLENVPIKELLNNKEATWNKAYKTPLSNGAEAVRVPLSISDDLYWKYNDSGKGKINANLLSYLFMYKDTTSNIHAEWVTLLPDSIWLQGDQDKYVGKILVKQWNGTLLRLYSFSKEGKIKEFKAEDSVESRQKNAKTAVMYQTTCWERCVNPNGRVSADCQIVQECEITITETNPTTSGWDPCGGSGNSGGGSQNGGTPTGYRGAGNYTPQCSPNIPPNTSVGPNQLRPCGTIYTPVNQINTGGLNYNNFEDFANDPFYMPMFEELNEAETQFFKDHINLLWSGARNFNETINYGNSRFHNAQADNTNANAYKHMLWCGTNYLSWDLGNNTNLAQTFGNLHELGPGTANQHAMDNANNTTGINAAMNLALAKRNRDGMSEAAMNLMTQADTPCRRLVNGSATGALIKTDATGRK